MVVHVHQPLARGFLSEFHSNLFAHQFSQENDVRCYYTLAQLVVLFFSESELPHHKKTIVSVFLWFPFKTTKQGVR